LRGAFPQSLAEVAPADGVRGRGGVAVSVAFATVVDAQLESFGGFGRVGGLRGGRVLFGASAEGLLTRLQGARYLAGVAVSGTIAWERGRSTWRMRVRGRGLDARFTIDGRGAVEGTVDGRRFTGRVRL
jgi:hypothetical protein